MPKQNKKIQRQIVEMMVNLLEFKILDSDNEKNSLIPGFNVDFKYDFFGNLSFKIKERPKYVVELAKQFVQKVKDNKQEDFWNRAFFYSPASHNFSETGLIVYFEYLFRKL